MIRHQLQQKKHFTYQEELIADYILEHPSYILEVSAKELAKKVYTSSSTIVRFCKKLGYDGFPAFQRQYAREYGIKEQFSEKLIFENVTFEKIPQVLDNMYQYVLQETEMILDKTVLLKVISSLLDMEAIDLYGADVLPKHI